MESIRRFAIWFQANFSSSKLWRVTYKDGKRTRLINRHEAWNLKEIYGGQMWIDYSPK